MDKKLSPMLPIGAKRGQKNRAPTPSDTLIALGSTSTSSGAGSSGLAKQAIKREASSLAASSSPPKKQRPSSGRKASDSWSDPGFQIDPHELVHAVEDAAAAGDEDRIEGCLCSAARLLKATRGKPDSLLVLSLMFLAKTKPFLFQSENTIEAFTSILKRDTQTSLSVPSLKPKMINGVQVLAANIIYSFLREEKSWPKTLITLFTQDALNERHWVDSCKGLTDNITCSLGTRIPPKASTTIVMASNPVLAKTEITTSSSSSPTLGLQGEDSNSSTDILLCKETEEDLYVYPRFDHDLDFVQEYIRETTNEYLSRRPLTSEKNLMKFLSTVVGIPSIRIIVATKIEPWLQNPKLGRSALELFWHLVWNSTADPDTIGILLKSRVKTKSIVSHFLACIKEFLNQTEDNIQLVLRQAVLNEISVNRGGNNMQIICAVVNFAPEKATRILGILFQELLFKEDSLKNLRLLLREVVRSLRYESLNMTLFVATLVDEHIPLSSIDPNDCFVRERLFSSVIDLITLSMFLSVSPAIKEAASYTKPDRKDIMRSFQVQISEMQRSGLYWLQKSVGRLNPDRNEFIHNLNKLLLLEPIDSYCQKDNWPPENDRALVIRLASEIPLLEDSLLRLLAMAFSPHHVTPTEVIEMADTLIKRAASIFESDSRSYPVLQMQNQELFPMLLRSSLYRKPDNIPLPTDYSPPELVISDWYWKVWIQLVILTAHNPCHFGKTAWHEYPTLATLIEMAITNNFEFPPPTSNVDDLCAKEVHFTSLEKEAIIELENHLAAATTKTHISESNSLLLSKVQLLDPKGVPRRPPTAVLEQLKALNHSLKLGHLLCQSRSPDFLLDIIQRQQKMKREGSTTGMAPASMPWLNQLVEVHEDNYSSLPVQCLCEFLLGQIHDESCSLKNGSSSSAPSKQSDKIREKDKKRKLKKLVSYFSGLLNTDDYLSKELIDYFMKRLGCQQSIFRSLAAKALRLILTSKKDSLIMTDLAPLQQQQQQDSSLSSSIDEESSGDEDYDFLDNLMTMKAFSGFTETACESLRWALLVETKPNAVSKFVNFLSEMSSPSDSNVCLSVAHLLIDRPAVVRMMTSEDSQYRDTFMTSCSQLFLNHLEAVKQKGEPQYSWSDAQDRVIIQWESTGETAVLNIAIIHAMVILLTLGPVPGNERLFNHMMSTWFCQPPPQSFLVDTSEEALLLPDWLKLRLLRSNDSKLVDAALKDLESVQLVLFIQSFGLPTSSMEKLLAALDDCCEDDEEAVRASIPDERFMRHLIEVQWMRGVKSGHKFASMLGVDSSSSSFQASSSTESKSTSGTENKPTAQKEKLLEAQQKRNSFGGGSQSHVSFINFLQDLSPSNTTSSSTSSSKNKTKSIHDFLSNFSKTIGKELFGGKKRRESNDSSSVLSPNLLSEKNSLSQQFILDINNLLSGGKKGKQQHQQEVTQLVVELLRENALNSVLVSIFSTVMTASLSASDSVKSSSRLYSAVNHLVTLLASHPILKTSTIHDVLSHILNKSKRIERKVEEEQEEEEEEVQNQHQDKQQRRTRRRKDPADDKSSFLSTSRQQHDEEEEKREESGCESRRRLSSNNTLFSSESEDEWDTFLSNEVERSVMNSRELLHYLHSEADLKKLGVNVIFQTESQSSCHSISSSSSLPLNPVQKDCKQYLLPLLLHKTNFETIQMFMHKLLSPPSSSLDMDFIEKSERANTTTGIAPQVTFTAGKSRKGESIDFRQDMNGGSNDDEGKKDTHEKRQSSSSESGHDFNASLVLDLLTAALDCPRLWRGRDLMKPTHFILEDVLKLNDKQVERLIDFVIREGRPEKRADLLLRSCFFKESHTEVVFRKLAGIKQSLRPEEEGQEEERHRIIMMMDKNKETPSASTTSSTTNNKKTLNTIHTTSDPLIPSSLSRLLSRLPVSSFDLNLCRQQLTMFLRSLSPSLVSTSLVNTSPGHFYSSPSASLFFPPVAVESSL